MLVDGFDESVSCRFSDLGTRDCVFRMAAPAKLGDGTGSVSPSKNLETAIYNNFSMRHWHYG